MNHRQLLENLKALLLGTEAEAVKAVKEKVTWLFNVYYASVKLDDSNDLISQAKALEEGMIPFEKLESASPLALLFNENYRLLRLFKLPQKLELNEVGFKLDFTKLVDKAYSNLCANFYPCLPEDKLEISSENSLLDCFKMAMIGPSDSFVLILSKNELINGRYCLKIIEDIKTMSLSEMGFGDVK